MLFMQHSEGEDRGDTLTCSVASYEQSEKKREHVNNCWYSGYETERERERHTWYEIKDTLDCGM